MEFLRVEHTWRRCQVECPWVLKTRHGRGMEMPLVGQVSHWGGSEQKCCCFLSRAENWAPGPRDRPRMLHHWDELMRHAEESPRGVNSCCCPHLA